MSTSNVPVVHEKQKKDAPDPGNLMLLIYTITIALIIICGGIISADASELPVESNDAQTFRLEDVQQGELLLPGLGTSAAPAVLLAQEVRITVSGIAARVKVSQTFSNTSPDWVDGVYVFPLPEESAVDRLRMLVGEREIIGEIHEKAEAKAIYEKAKQEGRKTSLLAQNRPNIFTTRVANIGPGENVTIVIEYQQMVQYSNEVFSLRFPMAITPRYMPGNVQAPTENRTLTFSNEGWAHDTDQVPDASEISPPVAAAGSGEGPTMKLSVDLVSGMVLSRLESLYHTMKIDEMAENQFALAFTGEVLADRDFVLEWQAEKKAQASAALLSETQDGNRYLSLMLMPPQESAKVYVPREVVFILDVSGSMAGPSIAQAKEALHSALVKLRPVDRFNIISFNNTAHSLFHGSVPGTEDNLVTAQKYLSALKADGGTEMKQALELALDGEFQRERLRQVIFLTDGAVGNEDALFALINHRLGDSRLFTVGIGSAPNSYFMKRAASVGRGTYTYIGDLNEVQVRIDKLLSKISTPAITDIQIKAADGSELELEAYPNPIPDLYFGEPLVSALKVKGEISAFKVSGNQLGKSWEYTIDTSGSSSRPGLAALWARKKISSEMQSLALGADPEKVKKTILATALSHQLVSKYTSLVAVDKIVSKPKASQSSKEVVKTAAPRGMQMQAVFGGGSRTATPSALHLLAGSLLLLTAGILHILRRRVWIKWSLR